MDLITHILFVKIILKLIFGVYLDAVKQKSPHCQTSALPLIQIKLTLYLNKFRGKPAISKFDKPFTPNLKSSQYFATYTSSALQKAINILSACSRLAHLVSGHIKLTCAEIYSLSLYFYFEI